jgi:hypothetical protein
MPTLEELSVLSENKALAANDLIPLVDISAASNGSSRVRKVALALIGQGFTHAYRIDYNNAELLAQGVDDTDEEITLKAISANTLIDKVRLVVTTAFTGLTALNIFVGRTADTDGYIASVSGLAKGAKQNTGALIDTVTEQPDVITASDQSLVITFDPGANAEALDELTAGSVIVLVSLTEIADYANITTAQ